MTTQADKTTAAACSRQQCEGCDLEGQLLCLHTPRDLMDFAVLFISWFIPYPVFDEARQGKKNS